ncbi:MAG: DUF499 domain-containing protein [Deltaproteobacteria bacterium]|nr:DUF499 domain-containing protein [Deltaproteobacteria bacterium]
MAINNRERVGRGLEQLRLGLVPFVERELKAKLGGYWVEEIESRLQEPLKRDGSGGPAWDAQAILKVMGDNWQSVFRQSLGHLERSLVGELREVRNRWAHEDPFSSDDTYRALDSMHRLLLSISAPSQADEVVKMKTDLQRLVFDEQARAKSRQRLPLEGQPMTGLKPWRELVMPHPDVASGRYAQAEFAADLAQVYAGEGSDEYRDPIEFFRRTFITSGLADLLVGALQRLAGKGGDPVVELQTNFGGGKTHSMLALFHLFGGTPSQKLAGVEPVLETAGVAQAPRAKRAVLVGTHLSPGEVRKKHDGTEVRTLWGELAWQLGEREAFQLVAESDARAVSPGSGVLAELFRRCSPCLILIDEWVAYARQLVGKRDLPAGDFEAQASFAQALTEAAKAAPGTLVVASIPASKIEIGGEHGEVALETLKNVFERVGKPWRPASADEGFEIVRRRLFEPIGSQEAAERDSVIAAFMKMYKSGQEEFPAGCSETAYRRDFESAYPIHPELFRRLYDDWSTLDKFQRTRGVLRLLAKVIHRLWESNDSSLAILPCSIPIDDGAVKSELTRYLEDIWEPIISQDIDGPASMPLEIDRANPSLGRYSASRRVARTVYMGTAPGARGKNPGIDDRAVRLGCTQPGETPATFGDALRRLSDRARYIHQDGNRYWVSTQPNLNRLADDRASALLKDPETLHQEIVRRLRADKDRADFAGVHVCPETSGDVPDEPSGRLVVLGPEFSHRQNQGDSSALREAKATLEGRGNSPRINRNTLVFLSADTKSLDDLMQAAAQYLAWKSIAEEETKLNLDAFQRNQANTKTKDGNETVNLRIGTSWIHVLVPTQPDPKGAIEWQALKAQGPGSLAKRAAARLKAEELLLPTMGAIRLRMEIDRHDLWQGKNHISVAQLCEWFPRYLYLSRVCGRETLEGAILDATSQTVATDVFGIASAFDGTKGRYRGLRLTSQGPEPKLGPSTLIVKPEVAGEQIERERAPSGVFEGSRPNVPAGAGTGDIPRSGDLPPPPEPKGPPRRFYGAVEVDADRAVKETARIVEEVLQHLSTLPGAKARVTLDIEVTAPDGMPENVVRTVSENCGTLRFTSHGFEGE